QNTEQAQDDEGADEPELLTDDGEDAVGLREGEETPLLPALPDTDTEDPSGAQRVQPVQGLIARALRVGQGVQVTSAAARPVALDRDDGGGQSQDEGDHGHEELRGCADPPQQGEEHQKQNQGGGQVRAQQDEHGDQATPWQQRDEQVSPLGEFPQFVLAGQYAGAPQGEGDLGRFGGLDEQPADLQPTQGTVDLGALEDGEQQQCHRDDHGRVADDPEPRHRQVGGQQHQWKTDRRRGQLALEHREGRPGLGDGVDHRRGQHHDQAQGDEQDTGA